MLQRINEKPNIIQDYENGKGIPDQNVISKIERALGQFKKMIILFLFFLTSKSLQDLKRLYWLYFLQEQNCEEKIVEPRCNPLEQKRNNLLPGDNILLESFILFVISQ